MVKSNHLNRKSTRKPSQLLPNQSPRWKSQESCYWLIAGPPPHFGPIIWLTELPVPLAVTMETVATASVLQWSHHLGKTALKPRLLHKPQKVTGHKSELGRDVYGFVVTLGILYIEGQGYFPALLENLRGMSCSGTCWLLDGAWFQCRYGGFWMSSYRLMFPGVRTSLVLDLSLLSLVFSLILTVASRLLHPYSTDDKTSRLMEKRFSTVRDNQKGSRWRKEERRER